MDQQQIFDAEVERIIALLSVMDPTTDEYKKAVESLKVLCEARSKKRGHAIDPEVVFIEICKLVAIAWIINHEKLHVITTKAVGFVRK